MSTFSDFEGICLQDVFKTLVYTVNHHGKETSPRGIKSKEIIAPRIEIIDPRQRWITFKTRRMDVAYAIGELFWYLHGTNSVKLIEYYAPSIKKFSDDGETLNSAYGYLIFNKWGNQFKEVIRKLTDDPDSRQAIIFLREPADLWKKTKDSVCTNALQFFIRENKLHMITTMRSGDLFVGFMYDCFCFTMLQELMAIALHVDVGSYIHVPGSLHIYEQWYEYCDPIWEKEKNVYFDIGKMHINYDNVFYFVNQLCRQEKSIRIAPDIETLKHIFSIRAIESFPDYWKQIFLLLIGTKAIKLGFTEMYFYNQIFNSLLNFQNWFFVDYLKYKLEKEKSK